MIAYNTYQFPKELLATRPPGLQPALVIAKNARQEADFIAQRVKELVAEGMPLDEIAVLYRIHSHSVELQLALQHHNIPFVIRSGIRFFEKAHIKDMLAFLRVLHNPRDELSWRRLLPLLPGVGPASVDAFWKRLETADFDLEPLQQEQGLDSLKKKARRSVLWLLRLFEEATQLEDDPSAILQLFYEQEYQDHLHHTYDDAAIRSEEIETLSTFAKEYATTRAFLDEMTLVAEVYATTSEQNEPEPSIILSTVHQAKGLEWKAVFVLDLAERSFPFFFSNEDSNIEEERRLFYVASTRAKDQLYSALSLHLSPQKMGVA